MLLVSEEIDLQIIELRKLLEEQMSQSVKEFGTRIDFSTDVKQTSGGIELSYKLESIKKQFQTLRDIELLTRGR